MGKNQFMKRLTGAIDKNGTFKIGKLPKYTRHPGFSEESKEIQRFKHSAELIQPVLPNGEINKDYGVIYHERAIRQGYIEEDKTISYEKFE